MTFKLGLEGYKCFKLRNWVVELEKGGSLVKLGQRRAFSEKDTVWAKAYKKPGARACRAGLRSENLKPYP